MNVMSMAAWQGVFFSSPSAYGQRSIVAFQGQEFMYIY